MNNEELKDHLEDKLDSAVDRLAIKILALGELHTERFTSIGYQLEIIKEQNMRASDRVTKLEEQMVHAKEVHLNCPVKKELDVYKDRLAEEMFLVRLMNKYPKTIALIAALFVILMTSGGIEGLIKIFGL